MARSALGSGRCARLIDGERRWISFDAPELMDSKNFLPVGAGALQLGIAMQGSLGEGQGMIAEMRQLADHAVHLWQSLEGSPLSANQDLELAEYRESKQGGCYNAQAAHHQRRAVSSGVFKFLGVPIRHPSFRNTPCFFSTKKPRGRTPVVSLRDRTKRRRIACPRSGIGTRPRYSGSGWIGRPVPAMVARR